MEERSAGAVVFRDGGDGPRFLLLKHPAGHWDFPKGHVEMGESDSETVEREVREETGLEHVRIVDGFRRKIGYFYRRDGNSVHKEVVFLLAEARQNEVRLSYEHQNFGWYPYKEALQRVTYNNSKRILTDANEFLVNQRALAS